MLELMLSSTAKSYCHFFLMKNWNTLSLTESAIFQEFVNSGLKGMAYRLIHQSEYWPLLM